MRMFGLATLAVALVACQARTASQPEVDRGGVPPSALTLRAGESRDRHGLTFTFVRVYEDSRCPVDVLCVWAGNGGVAIAVGPDSGFGPTHQLLLNTLLEPREQVVFDLRVRLTALAPEPVSTRPIPAEDYVVTLEVAGVHAGSP